jgi:hypothetical protein
MNNPCAKFHRKLQIMITEAGEAKGLKQALEKCSFDITGISAKCSPVCPIENDNCCIACLLSKQDNFCLQESLLEQKIKARGHQYIFLPKFHCELNLIEMVYLFYSFPYIG